MSPTFSCTIELPEWLAARLGLEPVALTDEAAAMEFAIQLASTNIAEATGGPFAAVVYDPVEAQLVAAGVNVVTRSGLSVAHAEIVALSLAQKTLGDWNLSRERSLTLVSTCEPCAMCFGALPWSGIARLVCGARKEDAERAGFDEGAKPRGWIDALRCRGIGVEQDLLRSEACRLFEQYHAAEGEMYNASVNSDEE